MAEKNTKKKKIAKNNIILIVFILLAITAVLVFNLSHKTYFEDEKKCNVSEGEWNETYQTCLKESEITYCKENQRNADVCIQVYDPVCGFKQGGEKETFSNSCFACSNTQVNFYVSGEC